MRRFVGIDVGAETIKAVELTGEPGALRWSRRQIVEHHKEPGPRLLEILASWQWEGIDAAAVSGRLTRQVNLPRVPTKQAQAAGFRFLRGNGPATLVSIGGHGFSVLELRESGAEVFRENSRCSQGTGNFLRQLVERFDMSLEEACALSADIVDPAPLSGRCPVILKTDMTHLANKGGDQARILAGLFDAVAENVLVLVKPSISPPQVTLLGGVSRSERVRNHVRKFLARHEMSLEPLDGDAGLFVEALGAASVAAERPAWVPALDQLIQPAPATTLEMVPALAFHLHKVTRMARAAPIGANGRAHDVVLGFDIGSTGSKLVAVDARTSDMRWEGYVKTSGDPVGAAQMLMRQFAGSTAGSHRVVGLGATGSGREIVGSLMATCYGTDNVFVLNEIAAHAEGALHYDPRVDTIFEIGGQDAKYIRLAEGRVVDAAMNEACSAGTGSFIEEQGRKFSGVTDIAQLGKEALAAESGVSLGQHCSVFMAEIIDEAVATGVPQRAIIAGIYDSIIQNYLNRVKGSRSVGQVVFCQGMPFAADALAAAVARQTGSQVIVPPNPGTVGALGIALLAKKQLTPAQHVPLKPERFLEAKVETKDVFVCKSTEGCGGAGNKCRIDRIATIVDAERQKFTWGGGCSLYDKGVRKRKLPDRAPDPFREREAMVRALVDEVASPGPARRRVAMTDEFTLKGLLPFYATFVHRLGFVVTVHTGADRTALKRGIEEANVPFCAPMQQYRGLMSEMVADHPEFLFAPMLRELPRVASEPHAVACPIVQASPDMLKLDLQGRTQARLISPVVDIGPGNLRSREFVASCFELAAELGAPVHRWQAAFDAALAAQERFDDRCFEIGREALAFCKERDITPVIVLGRPYTIYNTVLNSNVPALLREQGTVAIPVDCFPVDSTVPVFDDMFWSFGQRNLRAAHQVRRMPGVYSLYCSNYSCGPDSFNLHFYAYIMDGKPFAVIETDGHSGDAGTKTRIEAFLHCVAEDLAADADRARKRANQYKLIELAKARLPDIKRRDEVCLIARVGPGAEALAAALRGVGYRAESLPMPTRDTVRVGRRHTSGKECVPMTITLGSVLERLESERDTDERFTLLIPRADGPCRFGTYNMLYKITLERLGWKDRVSVWSPSPRRYFEGAPAGLAAIVFAGVMAEDLLLEALYDVRPVEKRSGAAEEIYARYTAELRATLERAGSGNLSIPGVLLEVASGRLFGCMRLLERAAREFAAVKGDKALPTVLVVGEIYVRCDPFANDFIIEKLEQRGIRARFAAFNEWLEYTNWLNARDGKLRLGARLSGLVQGRIQRMSYAQVARPLGWPRRTTVRDTIRAAQDYIRPDLRGEAILTVGGPVYEWREGHIDGVVSVGPLECMPAKVAEAQFFHVAEREGLLSLSLPFNGDPLDPEIIDNFAFEVHGRFRSRHPQATVETMPRIQHSARQRPLPDVIPIAARTTMSAGARRPRLVSEA